MTLHMICEVAYEEIVDFLHKRDHKPIDEKRVQYALGGPVLLIVNLALSSSGCSSQVDEVFRALDTMDGANEYASRQCILAHGFLDIVRHAEAIGLDGRRKLLKACLDARFAPAVPSLSSRRGL